MYSQPPFNRVKYHGISSGRLPAQVIRNCENEKYAHTITLASNSLPRSCKWRGVRISLIGRRYDIITMITTMNDIDDNPWPAINRSPNMVENQCGSIDSTQSVARKVRPNAQ